MDDQVLSQLTGIPVQQIATYNNMQKQQLINMAQSKLPKINASQQQNTPIIKQKEYKFDKNAGRAKNDMSAVEDFKQAFRQARQEGNKTFFWKKTKANPSGMFSTELASSKKSVNEKPTNEYENVADESIEVPLKQVPITISSNKIGLPSLRSVQEQPIKNTFKNQHFPGTIGGRFGVYMEQGGNLQQNNIEQQVVQLVQAAASGDKQATQQIEQIMQSAKQGDQQALRIAQLIQEAIEAMTQQKGIKAALGTKLNYINKLKGICPEGSEKVYMAKGGCMCKQKALKGDKVVEPNDTIHYNKKVYDLTGKHKQYKPLTNKDYRNLPTNKQADVDNKDMMRAKDKKAEKKACGGKSNTLMKKKK